MYQIIQNFNFFFFFFRFKLLYTYNNDSSEYFINVSIFQMRYKYFINLHKGVNNIYSNKNLKQNLEIIYYQKDSTI